MLLQKLLESYVYNFYYTLLRLSPKLLFSILILYSFKYTIYIIYIKLLLLQLILDFFFRYTSSKLILYLVYLVLILVILGSKVLFLCVGWLNSSFDLVVRKVFCSKAWHHILCKSLVYSKVIEGGCQYIYVVVSFSFFQSILFIPPLH